MNNFLNNLNLNKIIKIIMVFIVLLLIILLFRSCSEDRAKIELVGNSQMAIYQNDRYIEPGYNIVETNNKNGFYINIEGYVNTNKVGVYTLVYNLYNKNGKIVSKATREVTVLEDNLSNLSLYLLGEDEEYFFINDYVDHGIEAYNYSEDVTKDVVVNSNVNPAIPGEYTVIYQISNNNYSKEIVRKVYIVDYKIEEENDESNLLINLDIKVDNYYYTLLPDGTKDYSRYISFRYNEIGEYEFDIYLKNLSHKKYSVSILSIDRDGPVGTCDIYYENNKSTLVINATDESGILKYSYNGLDFYNNNYTLNSIAYNVTVKVYDKHNNYTDIKCSAKLKDGFRSIDVTDDGHVKNKSGYIKCGTSVTKDSEELDLLMRSYGYKTRAAVAMAATYLANYKYNIPYFWGGKTIQKGIDPTWGCRKSHSTDHNCSIAMAPDKSSCAYGLDCGGLVRWAYVQAGFDPSVLRGDDLVVHRWGNFNPKEHLYKFYGNINMANQIKPGDIVHKPGHVAVVIGVDANTLQIAEMTGPVIITIINKSNGASINHQSSFTEFVLMDEFFKMYGTN